MKKLILSSLAVFCLAMSASAINIRIIHKENGGPNGYDVIDSREGIFVDRISCTNPGSEACKFALGGGDTDPIDDVLINFVTERLRLGQLKGNAVNAGRIVVWSGNDEYNVDLMITDYTGIIPILQK